MDHIIQYNTTMSTNLSGSAFDTILYNIKMEYESLFNDESSDLEDSGSIDYKFFHSIDKKQRDEMCEFASTSSEMDVYVSESNLLVTTLMYFIYFKYITLLYLIIFTIHTYFLYIFSNTILNTVFLHRDFQIQN